MLKRLRIIFRSLFGWMLRSAENPELILRQHMDDLRNKIPQMNEQVKQIIAVEKQAELAKQRLAEQLAALQPKCEIAVKLASTDETKKAAALTLLTSLNSLKAELAEATETHERLKVQSTEVMANRQAYEQKIRAEIQKCMSEIGRSKRAAMEQEFASLTMSFQVGDQNDTLERMTEKIDEQQAQARAATEVASTSVDSQMLEIEKASSASQAEDMFAEMQRQLGIVTDDTPASVRTMNAIPAETKTAEAEKPAQTIEGTN